MNAMREQWTDARLDDLNSKVDIGFDRVDRRFNSLESRIDARFDSLESRIDTRFDTQDARFTAQVGELNARFDSMQRTMIQIGGVMIAALLGLIATQL